MHDSFRPIIASLIDEGFHHLSSGENKSGKKLDFNITNYSLNTKLSFKFENLAHFIEFLKLSQPLDDQQQKIIEASLLELNLQPHDFFYVNFFEKGKELEM